MRHSWCRLCKATPASQVKPPNAGPRVATFTCTAWGRPESDSRTRKLLCNMIIGFLKSVEFSKANLQLASYCAKADICPCRAHPL